MDLLLICGLGGLGGLVTYVRYVHTVVRVQVLKVWQRIVPNTAKDIAVWIFVFVFGCSKMFQL
jgi:hypothetical protein